VPMEDVYNMNGMGIALGLCTNTRVLASSLNKKAYSKSRENREWVSIKSVFGYRPEAALPHRLQMPGLTDHLVLSSISI
jgi:hypothetical protein